MNIITNIEEVICDFISSTGVTPTSIYLGKAEPSELINWAIADIPVKGPPLAAEVAGCKVFLVNADEHIGVS